MSRETRLYLKIMFPIFFIFLCGFKCDRNLKSDLPIAPLKIDNQQITVEVANKPATRSAGLMFRKEMDQDVGMLFVFPNSEQRAFWMKNTVIPLSIAFADEKGTILNILEMPPETEESFFSKGPAKFALEMNAAWFANHGIKAGDSIEGALIAPKAED
jgi:uncharacterized protein